MAHEASGSRGTEWAVADVQRLTAVVAGGVLTLVGVAGVLATDVPTVAADPLASGVHLLTGVVGLGVGLVGATYADEYNQSMAVLYGALALLRFRYPELVAGVADAGVAGAWFHLALVVVFGVVGFFAPMVGYRSRD